MLNNHIPREFFNYDQHREVKQSDALCVHYSLNFFSVEPVVGWSPAYFLRQGGPPTVARQRGLSTVAFSMSEDGCHGMVLEWCATRAR